MTDVAPRDRDVAMVFQSYALYPHMSVEGNMGFALKHARGRPSRRSASACAAGDRLGIGELLHRRPRALSGGQRQRVALGRAIVRAPQAFLMDEPLSNLDAKLRVEMRAYIARLHQELGTTTLYVTHDQVEAMTMGDRVAVMRDGRLEQVDTPQALYDRPANLFVAAFIGSPAMNLVRGRLEADDDGLAVGWARTGSRCPRPAGAARRCTPRAGEDEIVGIRPEALSAAAEERPMLEGEVMLVESLGSDVLAHVEVDAPAVLAGHQLEAAKEILGGEANGAPPQRARVTARLEPSVPVATGKRLALDGRPAALPLLRSADGARPLGRHRELDQQLLGGGLSGAAALTRSRPPRRARGRWPSTAPAPTISARPRSRSPSKLLTARAEAREA